VCPFRAWPGLVWVVSMRFAAVIVALFFVGTAFAQDAAAPAGRASIRFTFENPQLEPAAYSLEVYENGEGSYTASVSGDPAAQASDRAIRIHDPLLARLFDGARTHHFFAIECEQPHSRVAFTGKKTLAYSGPDGKGSCTFNYSRDPAVNGIADDLMSVAFTLEEGERLKREHLHDRLSLDSELEELQSAAQSRRALELGNIAPVLESIAEDDAVMNRARSRARALMTEPASIR
jgi:hypothetical protein